MREEFPEPFESELEPTGSPSFDTGQSFQFSVDESGFTIVKSFGPAPADALCDFVNFFPDSVVVSVERSRLSEILDEVENLELREADKVKAEILEYGEGLVTRILEFEAGKTDEDLEALRKAFCDRSPESAGVPDDFEILRDETIMISPVTYWDAPNPSCCALDISFSDGWRLEILCDDDVVDPFESESEVLECETFKELMERREEIGLDWSEEKIRKTLLEADPRWEEFIDAP